MKIKKSVALLLAAALALMCLVACGKKSSVVREKDTRELSAQEYTLLNLSGTDALGRTFLPADEENKELYVGMFFYLTLGYHANHSGIYDVSKITNYGKDMDAFYTANNDSSPVGAAHFWGEPIWGYYRSDDEWVIRKQVEMLTMAGIDFLRRTNSSRKPAIGENVAVIGGGNVAMDVAKFMFYVAANDKGCIRTLYETYYSQGLYRDLWFAPAGKPLITQMYSTVWDTDDVTEKAISELFEFRYRQWPTESFLRQGWSWIEFEYPQPIHTDMVSVSSAQHTNLKFSDTSDNRGKGFDLSTMKNDPSKVAEGANYASQWERVLSGENNERIRFVNLTGWNEWIALKLSDSSDRYFMVDQFDYEYSRDLEPMKGGYGDNYYMQTIQNIRKWKYSEAKHYKYEQKTVDVSSFDESAWESAAAYLDFTGECIGRDHPAFGGAFNYIDDTDRNDIASVRVLHDSKYAYFRVETVADITAYESGDTGWMNILLQTGGGNNHFMGYQYALNKNVNGNSGSVSRYTADGKWESFSNCDVYVQGNVMQVRVKLSDIGLSAKNFCMQFKVTDNVKKASDAASYYTTGDSAPIGRLSYTYGY